MSSKKDKEEYVMTIPISSLYELGYFEGINFEIEKFISLINSEKKVRYMKREKAEYDQKYKQVIPYIILINGNKIFSYKRGNLIYEDRLKGRYSIGIGGHITTDDINLLTETYVEGMKREINEEFEINTDYQQELIALINDDENEVGKVHLGIIHIFILNKPLVKAKESFLGDIEFKTLDELTKDIENYENWSKLCIKNMHKMLNKIRCINSNLSDLNN